MTIRTIALAALVGAAGCASSPAAAPVATTAPSGVFVAPSAGEAHLRNLRQLTFGGNNAEAYFNSTGTQITFQRQEKVDQGCDQQYLMNPDGSGMRRVSNGQGRTTCGYFYDHDQRVLYGSSFAHDPACPAVPDKSHGYVWPLGYLNIWTSKLDGTDLRALTNDSSYNAEATVSPDGKTIIFTSTRDGDIELYTMRTDGSHVKRITHRVGYDGGAFFSPDGKYLVWRAGYPKTAADSADYLRLLTMRLVRPARVELMIANADGSNQHQITSLGGANFAPFFHPDGKRIIFSSNYENPRSGEFDLYMVNMDGSGTQKITTAASFDGFPMFSPDGKKLMWASNRNGASAGDTNLFIADWIE